MSVTCALVESTVQMIAKQSLKFLVLSATTVPMAVKTAQCRFPVQKAHIQTLKEMTLFLVVLFAHPDTTATQLESQTFQVTSVRRDITVHGVQTPSHHQSSIFQLHVQKEHLDHVRNWNQLTSVLLVHLVFTVQIKE